MGERVSVGETSGRENVSQRESVLDSLSHSVGER